MAGKSLQDAPQNFEEWLQGLIPEIARGMAAPNSTVRFCQQLMMVCAGKLKQHQQTAQQSAVAGVGGAGMGGPGGVGATGAVRPPGMQMPGAPAGGGAINPMQMSQAAPNLMAGAGSPTPDELRRVISQQAG